MTVPIVAIDTNSINMLRRDRYLNQLEEWNHAGLIQIKRAEMLAQELASNLGLQGELRRQKAARFPEGKSSRAFTLRRSTLRGGDTLRGPSVHRWVNTLTNILHGSKAFDNLHRRDKMDVLHLATCKLHAWHYFVTTDKGILNRAEDLNRQLGISAVSPAEAVTKIRTSLSLTSPESV